MSDAESKREKILYLSLGSWTNWSEWSVKALYEGISKIPKTRVIWSLKKEYEKFLPSDIDESRFWTSSWLPQVELLAHPAVKAGLSHCGFGGTLEFI